jgi:beta-glucuronidase
MRRRVCLTLLAAAAVAATAGPTLPVGATSRARAAAPAQRARSAASAHPADTVTVPSHRTLYRDGPDGRYLMDGPWLFRTDHGSTGLRAHFERQSSTAGWKAITVPYAWNATDNSAAGFGGGLGWYRKDFRLPSGGGGSTWVVRFESVNYRARVWLNGHALGDHTGTFLPFEFQLPGRYLHPGGVNRLVVRVDSHHADDSMPPAGTSAKGTPAGGWWNYGGLLREVYLRRVDRVDFASVQVRPDLPCAACAARIVYSVRVLNRSNARQSVHVDTHFGSQAANLGTHAIKPGQTVEFTGHLTVTHPRLWSPASPALYDVTLDASASSGGHGASHAAHWFLQSGIRSIRVAGGHLLLNGRPVNLRGVGLQEDSLQNGFAIDNTTRARFIAETKDLGADLIRSQYPLHPYLEELADQQGILLWSEIPVFSVKEDVLKLHSFRDFADEQLTENILDNGNHPSIGIWSIANELSSRPASGQISYLSKAIDLAHQLDPSRPVGLAVAGYPSVPCAPIYRRLQVLGVNDYFGWYPGPSGQIADRSLLSAYLDKAHACYRNQALMVTEFGAEANRNGPVQERGTYQFQSDFVDYHLGVFASKPYLSAAVYWALEEFRVRPEWDGGNPHPDPPVHEKGLVSFTGFKKPAYYEIQRIYHATRQLG